MSRRPYLTCAAALAFALTAGALLSLAGGTPRARSNILHVSTLILLVVVLWRMRPSIPASGQDVPPTGIWGLFPAVACGLIAWSGTIAHYFVADEFVHLFIARLPFANLMQTMLFEGESGTFLRPIGFLSYWLDSRVWSDWMPGYHTTNLLLHLGVTTGVYCLCRSAPVFRPLAPVAALVFALLPVHTEAVAWVGARFDLVSGLFVVWSIACYLRYRYGHGRVYGILGPFLALLAFFSKENAYVLPALLVAAELFVTPTRKLKAVWPFAALLAAALIYRFAVLGGLAGYVTEDGQLAATDIGLKTLEGLLVRVPSQSFMAVNWLQPGAAIWLAAATIGALMALAFTTRGEGRLIGFGFSWLILAAAPAHPLLLIGPGLTNSRVLYLGGVGVAVVVASILNSVDQLRHRLMYTTLLGTCFLLGTWHNLGAWDYTAAVSRQFAEELRAQSPLPPSGTEFVFHEFPESIRGVYFLRVSMVEPVRVAFGRDDLTGYRAESMSAEVQAGVHYDWIGGREQLIRRR